MKFLACLTLTTLVSLIVAVPFPREDFTRELGKSGHYDKAVPHEEKRAPSCRNAAGEIYCQLEVYYEDSCFYQPGIMKQNCRRMCGFC
ncbi:unnamed protein product [Pocillopora meandrina]|uniref:ShKT domain-containing protein n=1 Tax=Pocillopora meandrina TaxID=46732 RepID=A0AAU9X381_9CNID|nr:unnamed protein product [Pocillopora meandrina]